MRAPLNLATRPVRNDRLPALLFLAAAGALLLVTLQHAVIIYRLLPRSSRALHEEVAKLTQEQKELDEEARQLQTVRVSQQQKLEWAALKTIVDRRTFWWSKLLEVLEQILPNDLRIVSLIPRVRDDDRMLDMVFRVRQEQESIGFAFAKTLASRPEFAEVDTRAVNFQTQGGEIEFNLTMRYLVGEPQPAPVAPTPPTAAASTQRAEGSRP